MHALALIVLCLVCVIILTLQHLAVTYRLGFGFSGTIRHWVACAVTHDSGLVIDFGDRTHWLLIMMQWYTHHIILKIAPRQTY
jgi:hypothetical protein